MLKNANTEASVIQIFPSAICQPGLRLQLVSTLRVKWEIRVSFLATENCSTVAGCQSSVSQTKVDHIPDIGDDDWSVVQEVPFVMSICHQFVRDTDRVSTIVPTSLSTSYTSTLWNILTNASSLTDDLEMPRDKFRRNWVWTLDELPFLTLERGFHISKNRNCDSSPSCSWRQ